MDHLGFDKSDLTEQKCVTSTENIEWKSPIKTYSKKLTPPAVNDKEDGKSRYGRSHKPKLSGDFLSTDKKVSHYLKIEADKQMHYFKSSPYTVQKPVVKTPEGQITPKRGRGRPRKSLTVKSPDTLQLELHDAIDGMKVLKGSNSLNDFQAPVPTSTETVEISEMYSLKEEQITVSDNEEFINEGDWNVGDLAWACVGGYPYWPCAITKDPENNLYKQCKVQGRNKQTKEFLHVRFFGDKGRRTWIMQSHVLPFHGLDPFLSLAEESCAVSGKKKDPKLFRSFTIPQSIRKNWQAAVSEAESLIEAPRNERVAYFVTMFPPTPPSEKHLLAIKPEPKKRGRKRKSELVAVPETPQTKQFKLEGDNTSVLASINSNQSPGKLSTPAIPDLKIKVEPQYTEEDDSNILTERPPMDIPLSHIKSEEQPTPVKTPGRKRGRPPGKWKKPEDVDFVPVNSKSKKSISNEDDRNKKKENDEERRSKRRNQDIQRKLKDSAYEMFYEKNFDRVTAENPSLSVNDIDKFVEKMWEEIKLKKPLEFRSRDNAEMVNNDCGYDAKSETSSRSVSPPPIILPSSKTPYKRGINLFSGVRNEKVCQLCFKSNDYKDILKCSGPCGQSFHLNCLDGPRLDDIKEEPVEQMIKKKRGRPPLSLSPVKKRGRPRKSSQLPTPTVKSEPQEEENNSEDIDEKLNGPLSACLPICDNSNSESSPENNSSTECVSNSNDDEKLFRGFPDDSEKNSQHIIFKDILRKSGINIENINVDCVEEDTLKSNIIIKDSDNNNKLEGSSSFDNLASNKSFKLVNDINKSVQLPLNSDEASVKVVTDDNVLQTDDLSETEESEVVSHKYNSVSNNELGNEPINGDIVTRIILGIDSDTRVFNANEIIRDGTSTFERKNAIDDSKNNLEINPDQNKNSLLGSTDKSFFSKASSSNSLKLLGTFRTDSFESESSNNNSLVVDESSDDRLMIEVSSGGEEDNSNSSITNGISGESQTNSTNKDLVSNEINKLAVSSDKVNKLETSLLDTPANKDVRSKQISDSEDKEIVEAKVLESKISTEVGGVINNKIKINDKEDTVFTSKSDVFKKEENIKTYSGPARHKSVDSSAEDSRKDQTIDDGESSGKNSDTDSDKVKNKTDWMCNLCREGKLGPCHVCGKLGEDRIRCGYHRCNKVYHRKCADNWPHSNQSVSNKGRLLFHCPQHVCHTCVSDNPTSVAGRLIKEKLVRCVKCPATYHYGNYCIPAGSEILSVSEILCPRHYNPPKKGLHHVNASWCFLCVSSSGGSLICCDLCPHSFHLKCLKISEPDGSFICEDCDTGRYPLYGEIVWVKLGTYRWWPAKILFPQEVPDNINQLPHTIGEFAVEFFGSHDFYWVNRGRVFIYHDGDFFKGVCKSRTDELFSRGLEEAQQAFMIWKEEKQYRDASSRRSMKPPKYVKIQSNRLVGNVGKYIDSKENLAQTCECTPDMENPCGPESDCINRLLSIECSQVCPAGDKCSNQNFERRCYPRLLPFKTETRGWGLKTLDPIAKGQFIIEYVGEMIDEEEYQKRLVNMQKNKDENFYFLTLDKDRMIDAGPKGNVARFMNHSCDPNCETQKWTVNGDTRVGLFALENIQAGSELVFNYNLATVGDTKVECKCGASNCAGYIGAKNLSKNSSKQGKALGEDKKGNSKKKRRKSKVAKHTEDTCFTCGSGGELLLCDDASCPKAYHLSCLGLTKHPAGGWVCPWHQCSVCSATKVQRCTLCINSYCAEHAEGNISINRTYGLLCFSHNPSDSGSDWSDEKGVLSDDEESNKSSKPNIKKYSRSRTVNGQC